MLLLAPVLSGLAIMGLELVGLRLPAPRFGASIYAPFYCLTTEFFEAARTRLAPSGLLSMNVYAPGGDSTLAEAVVATLAKVFPTTFELSRTGELERVAREAAAALRVPVPGGAAVLTDDRAPVEPLTHRMIVRRDRLRSAIQLSGGSQ